MASPGVWVARVFAVGVVASLAVLVLGAITLEVVTTPSVWRGMALGAADWRALGWSVGSAVVIGLGATLLGWGMAPVLARGGVRAGLMLLPMLLPPYLAYAGWGQLRAPGTFFGDWLLEHAAAGERWLPIVVGRGLAGLGLMLWAAPIAGLVLAAGLVRRGRGFDEALLMDQVSWWRRGLERVKFHRADLLGALLVVALVMMGSAVPLHVAQVPTASIELWLDLTETAPDQWGLVWARGWPLGLLAVAAAWWLGRAALRERDEQVAGEASLGRGSVLGSAWGWMVWGLAVAVPVWLCASNLSGWSVFERSWRLDRAALGNSLLRAGVVAGVIGVLACAVSVVLCGGGGRVDRRVVRVLAWVAIVLGVLPGFAVGAAVARWALPSELGPIAAHAARFGFIGVLGGVWAVRSEPRERQDARQMESDGGLLAWWLTAWPGQWRVLLGSGLAAGVLSLHEIEASVFVDPPGGGSIAQKMLGHLHFARTDELNAMSLVLVVVGLLPAVAAGMCLLAPKSVGGATDPNRGR